MVQARGQAPTDDLLQGSTTPKGPGTPAAQEDALGDLHHDAGLVPDAGLLTLEERLHEQRPGGDEDAQEGVPHPVDTDIEARVKPPAVLTLAAGQGTLFTRLAEESGWSVTSAQPDTASDVTALSERLQQGEFSLVVAAVPGRSFSQLQGLSGRSSRSLRYPLGGGRGRPITSQEVTENELLRLTCEVLQAAAAAGVH